VLRAHLARPGARGDAAAAAIHQARRLPWRRPGSSAARTTRSMPKR
jgi:hypothetical protein